ncbi:sialidase family protein [Maribacter sp. HTCC2170]|uniref:sialidase family protein n=1 Tax=Maribacter sp. (strain HTCC2170 / KCCM 42371) TaxID=313603 RepID=UPI00006BD4D3|nr:sialidase family protein [Maribacter sp. HTCC2170]EAR02602.1 putative neuramidase [Maribacter sp. HTCC2170]
MSKTCSQLLPYILFIVFTGLVFSQNTRDLSKDSSNVTTPFYSGLNGYYSYRIPTLIKSKKAVIAFAEGRKNSTSDFGNIDLVYRRSLNKGKTWQPIQILVDEDTIAVQNPVPIYVKSQNKIVLLFNITPQSEHDILNKDYEPKNQRRALVIHSVDDGKTWSTPKDITKDVKLPHWRWHAIGPVHGIELKQSPHKGRLVAPVAISIEKGNKAYCMALIYSDDQGENWKIGAIDNNLTDTVQSNETTIVELNDGSIYVNTRDHLGGSKEKNRGETYSIDGGLSFSQPIVESSKFPSPIVQSALLRWGSNQHGKQNLLLFSTPSNRDKRVNLILMASSDEAKTWKSIIKVHNGFSAYSDMVKLNKNILGVIYETDNYKKIKFKRIKLNH